MDALRAAPRATSEILKALGSGSLSGAVKKAFKRLDDLHLTALTIPGKPRSRNQKQ